MQLSGCADEKLTISGGNDEGVPPVPIPNTEVKPFSADGTWLVTARESRSPPDSKYNCRRDAAVILSLAGGPHSQSAHRIRGMDPVLVSNDSFTSFLPYGECPTGTSLGSLP